MKRITTIACLLAVFMSGPAQSLKLDRASLKSSQIILAKQTAMLDYNDFTTVAVAANCDYSVTTDSEWLSVRKMANGNVAIFGDLNYNMASRTGAVIFTSADGTAVRTLMVVQGGNEVTDTKIPIASGTASQSQPGEGIELSYDGDYATYYHSPWYSTTFPVTLTYNLKEASHVDYAVYNPRPSSTGTNGNFKVVTVQYKLKNSSSFVELGTYDFGGSSSASQVTFGDNGIDDVVAVKFIVKSGAGDNGTGFASCAEMEFYKRNDAMSGLLRQYFADNLCTKLNPDITEEQIAQIPIREIREMAQQMYAGTYSMEYRVGEYMAYRSLGDLQSELQNSHQYNNHENPTGITFAKGETVIVVAEGIGTAPVSLLIRNFGPTEFSSSTYSLQNGINILSVKNKGNGYLSYYTTNWQDAPKVKLHFFNGTEQGYFSPKYKGHTDSDWKQLLKNAQGDCLDLHGELCDCVFPVTSLKANCPNNGTWLLQQYDDIVNLEREVLGIYKYNHVFPNRQCVITVSQSSGLYHASNDGFCVPVGSIKDPTTYNFTDYWGFAHELGHNNQTRGFVYTGLTEVTNNIMSSWVQHKLRKDGYHRLEDESYGGLRGERIQAYLQNGVCEGNLWQLQPGPDSYGKTFSKVTVDGQDENGNSTGSVETVCYGHDVFVKLVPLYQLLMWTEGIEMSKGAYPKLYEGLRTYKGSGWTNGQQQIRFMRMFCDSTQINFLPFFEKAGLLKPAKFYQDDYSKGWIVISQKMVDDLKAYIAGKNYEEAPAGLNYLTAYNMDRFRDKVKLETGTLGTGCTKSGSRIRVDNTLWPGAVGYETYDANGNHIASTVFGYGEAERSSKYTQVMWPSKAAYIMAVGYDGTRVKIYEP